MRLIAAVAAALAVSAVPALSGCGAVGGSSSILDKSEITIGVAQARPGLGLKAKDGTYQGFEIDVARYIAGRLGFEEEDITFATPGPHREVALESGEYDMVIATYSIAPARKQRVTFGGPYYVAHQDVLVREDNTDIQDVDDLEGRRVCKTRQGSLSFDRLVKGRGVAGVQPVEEGSYRRCVAAVKSGKADAVSTDDLILAGLAAADPDKPFRLLNKPFSDERYGVGLPKGDLDACEAVNRAITEMYRDGTARSLLHRWFKVTATESTPSSFKWYGIGGVELGTDIPQFEGCS